MNPRAAQTEILDVTSFMAASWCADLLLAFRAAAASSSYQVRRLQCRTEIGGSALVHAGAVRMAAELDGVRERARTALGEFFAVTGDELHIEYTLFSEMGVFDAGLSFFEQRKPQWLPYLPGASVAAHRDGKIAATGTDHRSGGLVVKPRGTHIAATIRLPPIAGRMAA